MYRTHNCGELRTSEIGGHIEIKVNTLDVLNASKVPPFTIGEETDGGDDLRMKYRFLDLRRSSVQRNIIFRSQLAIATRQYLASNDFIEVETPVLIKSTPEGARDFVVPSRMNGGQFYALPQSPQTFKQLLMVSGFTMNIDLGDFPRMQYDDAMQLYGSDKPDLRFGMPFTELNDLAQGHGFSVFDNAELVVGICVKGEAGNFSNKALKKLEEWMKRPQIGAKG